MSEADSIKIREVFSILTQGVELVQYEVDLTSKKSSVHGRIVWMDSDTYRICVDSSRPAVVDRAKGKIPPGIYLRDICEVRAGSDVFHYTHNAKKPAEPEHCLSLVGTERTISLEFPSTFSRDWFYTRFILLTEDVMTDEERKEPKYRLFNILQSKRTADITPDDEENANHLQRLLERGIEVKHHNRFANTSTGGSVEPALLSYDATNNLLLVVVHTKSIFSFTRTEVIKMEIDDIAEIRPGTHSYGFVKTNSTGEYDRTFSIISTEWVFDLEVISKSTRDLLIDRLFDFLLVRRKVARENRMPTD